MSVKPPEPYPGSYTWTTYQPAAQKCPACDGWGKRDDPDVLWSTTMRVPQLQCAACKGAGVVWPPAEASISTGGRGRQPHRGERVRR